MGCHGLLQGIFPNQGSNPGLLHGRWTLYCLNHQGSLISVNAIIYYKMKSFAQFLCLSPFWREIIIIGVIIPFFHVRNQSFREVEWLPKVCQDINTIYKRKNLPVENKGRDPLHYPPKWGFPGGSVGKKNPPAMWETWDRSLGQENPLEKGMATDSSFIAWRIPWKEEIVRLQSMGLQTLTHFLTSENLQVFFCFFEM